MAENFGRCVARAGRLILRNLGPQRDPFRWRLGTYLGARGNVEHQRESKRIGPITRHCVLLTGRTETSRLVSAEECYVTSHGQARFSYLDRQTELHNVGNTRDPDLHVRRAWPRLHTFAWKRNSRQWIARWIRFLPKPGIALGIADTREADWFPFFSSLFPSSRTVTHSIFPFHPTESRVYTVRSEGHRLSRWWPDAISSQFAS